MAIVLFNLPVLLDDGCVNPYCWGVALLAIIIALPQPKVHLIWPKSASTRLRRLLTSIVNGARETRLFSFNILFKIISPKRPMSLGILVIHIFKKCQILTKSLNLGINHFFNSFFPVIQLAAMPIQLDSD